VVRTIVLWGQEAMTGRVRCAVYTRKSSEEGLEQSFNSLDAQRKACEAYILSQRHEGWHAISTRYDDGGFSGSNMERPGLKKLLDDIAAKRVQLMIAADLLYIAISFGGFKIRAMIPQLMLKIAKARILAALSPAKTVKAWLVPGG
jgi:Resolvase, N terminal domain